MQASRGHWLALIALMGAGCRPESPPPSPPTTTTCATVELTAPLELETELATANVARLVVTESRVWVAYTFPVNPLSGESEVRLASFDCAKGAVERHERPNTEPVAANELLASASADHLLLGWDGVNATAAAPLLRSYELATGQADTAKPLVLAGANATSQAALRLSSLRPLDNGGFVVTGTTDAVGGTCAQPFLQKLDDSGAPVGGFIDVDAGGFGRCARTIAPLQQSGSGALILNWVSFDVTGSSASWNNLSISSALLGGATQTFLEVPSSTGIDPSGLVELTGAAATSEQLTVGSEASRAAGPWLPQFMVLPSQPANLSSRFVLRDVLQPETARVSQVIEVRDGTIESPRLVSTEQGGLLAWTLVATPPLEDTALVGIRFAYNGDRWKVGERFSLVPKAPGQQLQAIAPVGEDRYFVLWMEGSAEARSLKGAFVQP